MLMKQLIVNLINPDLIQYDEEFNTMDDEVTFHLSSDKEIKVLSIYYDEDTNATRVDLG
jgi:hypothetical protein